MFCKEYYNPDRKKYFTRKSIAIILFNNNLLKLKYFQYLALTVPYSA